MEVLNLLLTEFDSYDNTPKSYGYRVWDTMENTWYIDGFKSESRARSAFEPKEPVESIISILKSHVCLDVYDEVFLDGVKVVFL